MQLSPRLSPGDRVAVVSPASTPRRDAVERCLDELRDWGLRPEVGRQAFDERSYLAGSDDDRLDDINRALRDPGIRAVFATRGGKGSYRIADRLDFDAIRRDPKPLVGFSDITLLLSRSPATLESPTSTGQCSAGMKPTSAAPPSHNSGPCS